MTGELIQQEIDGLRKTVGELKDKRATLKENCVRESNLLDLAIAMNNRRIRSFIDGREYDKVTQLRLKLAKRVNMDAENPKFVTAFDIAWNRGHSEGESGVENCFEELIPLLEK